MNKKSQTVIEYIILSTVVIAAIVSTKFIDKVKENFKNHFDKCKTEILR